MQNKLNHQPHTLLFVSIIFFLLLSNTFIRSDYSVLFTYSEWTLKLATLLMTLAIFYSLFKNRRLDVSLAKFTGAFCLFALIYLSLYFRTDYMTLAEWLQQIGFFGFVYGAARFPWRPVHLRIAGLLTSVAVFFFFIDWLAAQMPMSGFKSIYRNENYLGVLLFCFLYFQMIAIKYSRTFVRFFVVLLTLTNLVLIFATSARSVLLALILIILSWFIAKSVYRHFRKMLPLVLSFSFVFVGLYVILYQTTLGNWLNELSRKTSGKNLFSGRTEIWQEVVSFIMKKPLLGNGIGVQASELGETTKTAHNMYLQVLLEAGLFGFIPFLLLLGSIWYLLVRRARWSFVARWSACFMLGILLYNTFEMTLMQNNYSIALFQWLIMVIGIGFVGHEKEERNERHLLDEE